MPLLETVNFIIDYKARDGAFFHRSIQGVCAARPTLEQKKAALRECFSQLKAQGFLPVHALYVPGNYSLSELDDMSDGRQPAPRNAQTVYLDVKNCK